MKTPYQKLVKGLSLPQSKWSWKEDTICTPFPLVEEILDKLPINWSDSTLRFLDPCCGSGRFLVAIKERLVNAGIDEKHVVENMLYGADIDQKNVDFVRVLLDRKEIYNTNNIKCVDSLQEKWDMKFDVIVGNPPYQSAQHNLRERLWMQFVDLGFKVCDYSGHLAFVTPSSWSHEQELYDRWFKNKSPLHINIDECKKYFPGVGSTFSWYIIRNNQIKQNVTIQTEVDTICDTLPITAFGSHPMSGVIVDKLLTSPHPRLNAFTKSSHHTSKNYGKYSATPHPDFPIPVIKSISTSSVNYGWGRAVDPSMNTPRVIGFTMTNGWLDGNPFRVVQDGQTTHSFVHLPTQTITQAEILATILRSKLYKFAVKCLNSNRTVRAASIRALPMLDLSRNWTDNQLYNHFGLSEAEIKLVEETIK